MAKIKNPNGSKGTHNLSGLPEYKIWGSMKQRCLNPNNKAYTRYRGRGITVCKEWHDFTTFLSDMGRR